jgi:DNA-binding IclR family transcriptional regulator
MQSSIQVIDRMVALLDAIAERPGSVTLKDLSKITQLHPSTAFRILTSLSEHGFIERTLTGQYQLGVKLLQLGSRVQGRLDLRREAHPILEWLRDEINETVNLIVRESDEVVYLERYTPSRMMRVEQTIGGHMPLHVTAVGKLFLAEMGAEACLDYAERTGLPPRTPHSIKESAALWRAVKKALQQGYALDDQEAELGVGCIGIPVRDSTGRMIAGISVSVPIERRNADWIATVKQAGDTLSARLGYMPPKLSLS